MKRNIYKFSWVAAVVFAAFFALSGVAKAKSLYVIADINAYGNIPIQAYDITGTTLSYQWTGYVPDRDGGAVGMTIDSDSEILFVTYEFSGTLDIVDAKTMTRLGQVVAPGASNLAGIVYDHGKKKMYCVDRRTNHLYVYDWDSGTRILTLEGGTYKILPNTSAWGIALDETRDLLYVANSSQMIRCFNTATWTENAHFNVTPIVIGIAVDEANNLVYSGGWSGTTISKYNMNTGTETTATTVRNPIGFAVDQSTGLLYVTYYRDDKLRVFDSDFTEYWCSVDLGNPTGLCVPRSEVQYNPLNLIKTDDIDPVTPGGVLTYTICFDNFANPGSPVSNVVITDDIPTGTSFISASVLDGTVGFDGTTVTWDFGTVGAGAGPYCMDLVVGITGLSGDVITNVCYIDSSIGGTHVTETTDITDVVTPCCDLDGNNDCDIDDYNLFLGAYGTSAGDPGWIEKADYDGDGIVALPDFYTWYNCYWVYMTTDGGGG